MATTKTPLQLIDDISNNTSDLFEVRKISNTLKDLAASANAETLRTATKALAIQLGYLAGHNSENYWLISDLRKLLTAQLLEDTADADEPTIDNDEPTIDNDEEVTENDLPFC